MRILIVDPKTPYEYQTGSIATRALGGTEATVIRVSSALALKHHVVVSQACRKEATIVHESLIFVPAGTEGRHAAGYDHVIFVQRAQDIRQVRRRHRRATFWLWVHNYLVDEAPLFWQDLAFSGLRVVCVSRTHMEHTIRMIQECRANKLLLGLLARTPVTFVYNPIDDSLAPNTTRVDLDKLVFFSSPYKGIDEVLEHFERVRRLQPSVRLFVANPGYRTNLDGLGLQREGVVDVGKLAHGAAIEHVRSACCVFYPQTKRPETFGLVYAEANAVGTPVLAHDFGAAREVLTDNAQLVDARLPDTVIERLLAWREGGRPRVQGRADFRMSTVARAWESLLSG